MRTEKKIKKRYNAFLKGVITRKRRYTCNGFFLTFSKVERRYKYLI